MANQSLTVWLNNEGVKKKIAERLGKNAVPFTSAVLSVYNGSPQLQQCDGKSILGAAFLAETLKLPITPGLGHAFIVPFKGKAQFQVGVRGYVQLAHRTGQYTRLHAGKVYDGEIRGFNPIGEPEFGEKISDEVVGYVAYMRLINGFEKTLYMTKAEIEAHAKKYSQSYGKNYSPWTTNFDEMAAKTVLKRLLRTWGVLSADMITALAGDQSVVDRDTFTYVDNGGNVQNRDEVYLPEETVDAETGEVISEEEPLNVEVQA
ncbi:MAG: recombinase RecT [Selenomonadaceae bacterium]|nr:recombinase RecT [Selenomonadaceae bacterium]